MKKQGRGRRSNKTQTGNGKATRTAKTGKRPWVRVAVAALLASALSLVLIMLYALCMYMGWLNIYTVPVANTVIKVLGALTAGLTASIGTDSLRIGKAAAAGAVYILLAFLIFSLLSGAFSMTSQILLDIGMGALAGALVGAVYSVVRKK